MNIIISDEDWEVIADHLMEKYRLNSDKKSLWDHLLVRTLKISSYEKRIFYIGLDKARSIIQIMINVYDPNGRFVYHNFNRTILLGNINDVLFNLTSLIEKALERENLINELGKKIDPR